jgi:hypothetical protein
MNRGPSLDPLPSREGTVHEPAPTIPSQSFEISGGSSETRLCALPICGGVIDVLATGRPPRFCSSSCRNFAAGKRRQARRNLAASARLRALAAEIHAGRPNGYSDRALERQAAYAESHAARLLAEIGEAPITDGHASTPVAVVGESCDYPCLAFGETNSGETLEGP